MSDTVERVEAAEAPVEGPARTASARPWAAGHVIVAVVIALVFGLLLNAQDLLATAERQPFGWERQVAVAVMEPVASFSAAIGFDRPRNLVDRAMGRADENPPAVDEAASPDAPIVAAPEDDPVDAEHPTTSPTTQATPTAEATPSASPTPTEPAGPMGLDRGPVTAVDPLRMYIGGDSMVEIQFGIALEGLANDTGMIETVAVEYDRGSGLTRPDYINWPEKLVQASEEYAPDIMVLYFGGNDAQPMKLDGVVYATSDPEWQAEYRSRVAGVMDDMAEAGHHVYWLGLPIPRSTELAAEWTILNDIYRTEAEARDAITFIGMWDRFKGPDGTYSEYLTNAEGDEVDMRLDDGIHYTTNGAYRAAKPTLAQIMDDFAITPTPGPDP